MPRIIAGSLGGRRIPAAPTSRTRPTSDRTRESVFARLESWGVIADAVVLDLFAGTGALGMESLSRGARFLLAVEAHAATARTIGHTLSDLGVQDRARVLTARLGAHSGAALAQHLEGARASLVFADPPYDLATDELGALIGSLADAGALADEAVVVVERSVRSRPLDLPPAFVDEGSKRSGDTRVEYATYLDPAEGRDGR